MSAHVLLGTKLILQMVDSDRNTGGTSGTIFEVVESEGGFGHSWISSLMCFQIPIPAIALLLQPHATLLSHLTLRKMGKQLSRRVSLGG